MYKVPDVHQVRAHSLHQQLLFKQANEGDNTTAAPGMFDFKGKAKWNAWDAQKGKKKEVAQA